MEKQDKWLSNYSFLIAGPPKSEMTEEEVEKCKELLTRAKEYLEKLSDDVIEKELENNLDYFLKKLDTDICLNLPFNFTNNNMSKLRNMTETATKFRVAYIFDRLDLKNVTMLEALKFHGLLYILYSLGNRIIHFYKCFYD